VPAAQRGFCPECGQEVAITKAGLAHYHGRRIKKLIDDSRSVFFIEYGPACGGSGKRVVCFVAFKG